MRPAALTKTLKKTTDSQQAEGNKSPSPHNGTQPEPLDDASSSKATIVGLKLVQDQQSRCHGTSKTKSVEQNALRFLLL